MLLIAFLLCFIVIGVQCQNCTYPGHGAHSWTSLDDQNATSFLPGTVVSYFCDSGFDILANTTRTCMHNGKWTYDEPICALNVANGRNITDVSRRVDLKVIDSVHILLDGYYGTCYPVKSITTEDEVAWEIDLLEIHSIDAVRFVVKPPLNFRSTLDNFNFGVYVSFNNSVWLEMSPSKMRPLSTFTTFVGQSIMTVFDVYAEQPVKARYVKIEKHPDNNMFFDLCELLVYSKTAISPEQCATPETKNTSLIAIHEGTCFNFFRGKDEHRDWLGAKQECESQDSYLARDIGESRQNFLRQTLSNAHRSWQVFQPDHYWIAGKAYKSSRGNRPWIWKWEDGKPIENIWKYLDHIIQPRILPGDPLYRDEECLAMAEELSWLWSIDHCNIQQSYICQHEVRSCGTPEQKLGSLMRIADMNTGVKFAIYNCSRGYKLSGHSMRMCRNAVGHWEGEAPSCKYVKCGEPKTFPGLQYILVDNSSDFGSRVKYTCTDSALSVVNGSQYWVCQDDHLWVGESPSCGVPVSSRYAVEEVGMWVLYVGIAIIVILLVFMGILIYICVRKQSRRAEFTVKHTKTNENASSRDHLETNEHYSEQGAANYGAAQTKQ